MKRIIPLITLLSIATLASAITPETYMYAERDTCSLYLDVYRPAADRANGACVVFAFGGGFRGGARNEPCNAIFMQSLAEAGYTAVAIDYRLGLKAVTPETKLTETVKVFENAVNVAVEDMIEALFYVHKHATELNIDPSKIAMAGSSAGAITALQTDYVITNGLDAARILPPDFRPAAVVSCAGAVCIFSGKPKYEGTPSPTLFLHGTKDELVSYNKFVLFGKGIYGSSYLVKKYKKAGAAYAIIRYENFGHEIASLPMVETPEYITAFLDDYVLKGSKKQMDATLSEDGVTKPLIEVHVLSYANPDNMIKDNGYEARMAKGCQ